MTDCVKVAVRTRPLSQKERTEGASECLQYFVDKSQVAINGRFFAFDCVFDPSCSQQGVYDTCAAPLLDKLFSGYNCTLIAYGQTGSGKTYTIGTEETEESLSSEERGIIPRVVDAIFRQADNSTAYSISVSMLEVYEEKILDLLSSNKEPLQIREKDGTTFVQGLTCEAVYDLMSTMQELEKGGSMRSKGETAMNLKSSRSHAIFTVMIDKAPTEHNETSFKSKLSIVDLAGSERLKKTMAEGERLREGIKINSGLLALGNVISALVEQGPNSGHIPYRDSKITRLLQDSLGGNSFTVMIACLSPADSNAEETLSTLRYADRAKKIRNKPVVNTDPNLAIIQELREQLAAAKHELALYRTGEHEVQSELTATLRFDDLNKMNELQQKYDDLLDAHRQARIELVEAIAENGHTVAQLAALEEENEKLKESLQSVRSLLQEKMENGVEAEDFSDVFKLLEASRQSLEVPCGEDEEVSLDKNDDEDTNEEANDMAYATRYAENQRKLANLLDEIKNKEKAVEATVATEQEIQKMREQHATEIEELKQKLDDMQQERSELLAKIRNSSNQNKVAEQRRKRVQELEREIALNRKRLMEITKLEKEKATLQERAKKLAAELLELKKLRVKMAKQMKEEETRFRAWKAKAERELVQMKNRERKREAVMARETAMSKQQLAVYRQKYEEANACNRRLQQQLCAAAKRKAGERSEEQINAFLDQELELAFSAAEAEGHCNVLIEQRKNLSAQHRKLMAKLKKLSERPPAKRRKSSDQSSINDEVEASQLRDEIADLQREIDLRNTELQDMQQKCAKAGDDVRSEQRWNGIHSLTTAKGILKRIFEGLVNERREVFDKERMVEELKRSEAEATAKIEQIRSDYERRLQEQRRNNEELKKAAARAEYMSAEKLYSLTAGHDPGNFLKEDDVDQLDAEGDSSKAVRRSRRTSRKPKKERELSGDRLSYHYKASSSKAKGDSVDLNSSDEENTYEREDKNDVTYYPTPELKARRSKRHMRVVRNPVPENRRESFLLQRAIQISSSEDGPNVLSDVPEQVPSEHNATFTIEKKDDDNAKIPSTLLTKDSSSAHLQRLTKQLFEGF